MDLEERWKRMNMEWQERLKEEYSELTQRLVRLELALLACDWPDEKAKGLLFEQRIAMRKYQDILFERICHAGIMLDVSVTQTNEEEK